MKQKIMRSPTNQEIAEFAGMKESDMEKTLSAGMRHASFDAPIKEDNDSGSFIDLYNGSNDDERSIAAADAQSEALSITHEMMKIIEALNEKERTVLQLYFGVDKPTNYTLEEIGEQMNLTSERVRQVKDQALKKLKKSTEARKT